MKTVSWYLSNFQMIDHLVIITPDRVFHPMFLGNAFFEYGDQRVSAAVISSKDMFLILSAGN